MWWRLTAASAVPFLAARFAPYAAIALIALALYGKGRWDGDSAALERWHATEIKAEALRQASAMKMQRKAAETVVQYVTRTKVIHDEIEKLVPVVTPQDDARCVVPPDFAGMWLRVSRAGQAGAAAGANATADKDRSTGSEAGRQSNGIERH